MFEPQALIPFHRDDEPCYPVDHQVLTVNLVGSATFQVSCKTGTAAIELQEGDYHLTPPGFQRTHKHAVAKTTAGRVSLTFRSTVEQVYYEEWGLLQVS